MTSDLTPDRSPDLMRGVPTPGAGRHLPAGPGERPRFLSEADCQDIAQRLARFASGGGETEVHIISTWRANVRWARNRITSTGEDRNNQIAVGRNIRGARAYSAVRINEVTDDALVAAARRAERLVGTNGETADGDLPFRPDTPFRFKDEPAAIPALFVDATYQLGAPERAAAAHQLMQSAATAGMLSAGYIEVSATSTAAITSWGYAQYYQYTWAQYSVTVRDPKGVGSGRAEVDWPDWRKIDGAQVSARALDKCVQSRNPVAIEPGRYTTILEPQAVCDFVSNWEYFGRIGMPGTGEDYNKRAAQELAQWHKAPWLPQYGEKIIDERLTFRTDPMDPELGIPPYSKHKEDAVWRGSVFHPVTWIEHGVRKHFATWHNWAIDNLGRDQSQPPSEFGGASLGSFRIDVSGATTTVEEMITTTKRGLLVTRFDQVTSDGPENELCSGYTRDGLWLIENGKISKPAKNLMFVESVLFALNNVEQLGVPQRVFHPVQGGNFWWYFDPPPVIVPAMKIRDFSFTALSDAV